MKDFVNIAEISTNKMFEDIDEMQQDFVLHFSNEIRHILKKLEKNPNIKVKFEEGDGLDQMLDGNLSLLFEGALTKKSMDKWVEELNQ